MESQQSARHLAILFLGLVILGGNVPLAGQAPAVKVVLENDRLVVGSRFSLGIVVPKTDPLAIKFNYGTLSAKLSLIDGPNISETSWEQSPGKLVPVTKISLTLKVLSAGIQQLGPWVVRLGSKDIAVPPVTVYLLASDEAKQRFPVDALWVVPPGPFYQGQAIPVILQVRNLVTLDQSRDLTVTTPSGALFEKVSGLGEIGVTSVGEDRIMNIPWGGWMLLPTKDGTLTLPSAKVKVLGLSRTAEGTSLTVLPLPEGARLSRAVGNLSYSVEAHEGTADQRGQVIITQEVKGQGNFPALVVPAVLAGSMTLLSRQERVNTKATTEGYEGNLIVTWRFQGGQQGAVTVVLPGFQVFQPATGLTKVWESRSVDFKLEAPSPETTTKLKRQLLNWNQVLAARPLGVWGQWWSWLLLLPGALFWAATFLGPRNQSKGLIVLLPLLLLMSGSAQVEAAPGGFGDARSLKDWKVLTQAHPHEPGLWYNQGLVASEVGQTALAIHAFRSALDAGFQGPEAVAALRSLEEDEALIDQFHPWTGLSGDFLFLLVVGLLNLAFLFWGWQRLSSRPVWLVFASILFLGMLGAVTVLVTEETIRHEANGVVGPTDGNLKKVPGSLAEKWMTLRAGTVVKILGSTEVDALVQTGYGLEGWLASKDLLLIGKP